MALKDESRWQQRFENFERAWAQLGAACAQLSDSDLELAGLVQMFEVSFELAWNTRKDLLSYVGYEVHSPRDAIRLGFAAGLIDNAELWLVALESRNRLSHTCDKRTAAEAGRLIKVSYAPLLGSLVQALRHKSSGA
jgi:nucleotidyltransferase substrate binding protein (TIGR01987 family)